MSKRDFYIATSEPSAEQGHNGLEHSMLGEHPARTKLPPTWPKTRASRAHPARIRARIYNSTASRHGRPQPRHRTRTNSETVDVPAGLPLQLLLRRRLNLVGMASVCYLLSRLAAIVFDSGLQTRWLVFGLGPALAGSQLHRCTKKHRVQTPSDALVFRS